MESPTTLSTRQRHGSGYKLTNYHHISPLLSTQSAQGENITSQAVFGSDTSRYAPHFGGYNAAVRIGSDYTRRARLELDIDEPSIEALQTLMLLAQASFQLGKGKKTFMLLSTIYNTPEDDQTANTRFRCRHKHGIRP